MFGLSIVKEPMLLPELNVIDPVEDKIKPPTSTMDSELVLNVIALFVITFELTDVIVQTSVKLPFP